MRAYRKSSKFENFFLYMFVGALIGIFIFFMIYSAMGDAPPIVKVGYGILGFSIFLAFWIGTLEVFVKFRG
ncbi:hypothetical protein AKJ57_04550 [candidate division MSBL1 archaeon SCGC-AAA259A05]|uniref:Uncharacterized protein n=1 Tax=candidate division MSBL1 archaeon SCGC-AAA259A05 TaxID=1698259 RepID=A0A133U751_9EURY|nr:hypothetical protein AKJ57_04550 [candidate division MSBL1 archaeon SCGC-AAA259A05]